MEEPVRFVGAVYLIYLGVRLLFRPEAARVVDASTAAVARRPARDAFAQGLLCELSNPKTLVVFTSVISPFLPAGAAPAYLAGLGVVFAVIGLLSCLVYAVVLGTTRRMLRRPGMADALLRGSGAVLVGTRGRFGRRRHRGDMTRKRKGQRHRRSERRHLDDLQQRRWRRRKGIV